MVSDKDRIAFVATGKNAEVFISRLRDHANKLWAELSELEFEIAAVLSSDNEENLRTVTSHMSNSGEQEYDDLVFDYNYQKGHIHVQTYKEEE